MIFEQLQIATADARGSITDILFKEEFEHSAIIETPVASETLPVFRGNHYHKETTQIIFIVSGKLTYWYKGLTDTYAKSIEMPKYARVTTGPNEIHALEFREPTTFVVFTKGPRGGADYESDTFRVDPIIPSMVTL